MHKTVNTGISFGNRNEIFPRRGSVWDDIATVVDFNAEIYFMRFFMRKEKENLAENPMFMLSQ